MKNLKNTSSAQLCDILLLQGLHSPLIQEDPSTAGQKELKLRFDVSQYTPEEIMVKTVDNKLLVSVCIARNPSESRAGPWAVVHFLGVQFFSDVSQRHDSR